MKSIIFFLAFLAFASAQTPGSDGMEETEEYQIKEIKEFLAEAFNQTERIYEFLEAQHKSVAVPLRAFVDCVLGNYSETLRTTAIEMASSVYRNETLEERRKFCSPPKSNFIFEVLKCIDYESESEFNEVLQAVIYLPFRLICNYDIPLLYSNEFNMDFFTNCTQCEKDAKAFTDILNGKKKPTKDDECLPIRLAKMERMIMEEFFPQVERIDLLMYQEVKRLSFTLISRLPFVSYADCYEA